MPFYLDTSFLVTAFSNEAETELVQTWLAEHARQYLCSSSWTITEFASALAFKVRTNQLQFDDAKRCDEQWRQVRASGLGIVEVDTSDFYRAADLINESAIALRSSDALHLAVAERRGFTLVSRDRKMIEAAGALALVAVAP